MVLYDSLLNAYSPGGLSTMCNTSPSMLAVPNLSTKVCIVVIMQVLSSPLSLDWLLSSD